MAEHGLDTPGTDDGTAGRRPATRDSVAKDFVQDLYYERGHWGLKIRESAVAIVIWVFLVFPILVLFNSVSDEVVWSGIYHWEYVDGIYLSNFIRRAIVVIVVVVLGFSIYLLLRNNYREKHVYPQRKTYDEDELARRKSALERMYAERFGDDEVRHTSRYYVVAPEQNLPTRFVADTLRKGADE